jgi:hypothetical protein
MPQYLLSENVRQYDIQVDLMYQYVWPCIIYENDERYQIVIYYHKLSLHVSGIYMPIFRSACCMLLHMVFGIRCCSCGPKELVGSLVHCV